MRQARQTDRKQLRQVIEDPSLQKPSTEALQRPTTTKEIKKGNSKDAAVVQDLKPKATIEIQDLDPLFTEEEIPTAVCNELDTGKNHIAVQLTAANSREQRRAFLSLPETCARKLLDTGRIEVAITYTSDSLKKRALFPLFWN
ncbi:hypothetical protein EVAR_73559_1 [Eumeta japonica]|uniref:Uncharacterized protein n=1 Tax=Eumeta variegata TaxID=151549 RepID=A0A4C2A791_EUMVA|nr:hypothetical protein EVAR_73559_1 [Eumeta japonica]